MSEEHKEDEEEEWDEETEEAGEENRKILRSNIVSWAEMC